MEEKIFWGEKLDDWWEVLISAERPSIVLQKSANERHLHVHIELQALIGCRQDPVWHPEGDVWNHTLLCMDSFAAERVADAKENFLVGMAVLCHDFGKPATTSVINGRISSRGHETAGEMPAREFMSRLGVPASDIEEIIPLIRCHMRPEQLYDAKAGDSAVRRLTKAVGGRLDRLVRVCRADKGGRGNNVVVFPAGEWILEKYRQAQ